MTGLDKILEQIKKESDETVSEKLAGARNRADSILEEARAEVKGECEHIESQGSRQAKEISQRAQSAADLYKRKAVLGEKQRIISEVFDKAVEKLNSLSGSEYYNTVIKIAVKNALPREGKIIFSQKDKDNVPSDFEMRLNAQLKEGSLKVSEDTRPMDGGFILSYGGVEENCTFKALIDASRESLADRVQEILFT
ncbi:MAG: V-type ATP synthase subunit E [Lachnospiraceae bacterium]|nr:V-type ATP synthase subunit E [Lachnospiraceae bacterium]